MAKPYSIDLCERAVLAVSKGGLSRHEAAARFGLGASNFIEVLIVERCKALNIKLDAGTSIEEGKQ